MTNPEALWQERLSEARVRIGRGLEPEQLAERYDVETEAEITELTNRGVLEMHNDDYGALTLDDLDKAAERMAVSKIVTDGGWVPSDPDPPALESFDPWKLEQPDDGIVYLYQAAVDKHWRIINDEDAALEEATGYPVEELLEHEEMGDYTDSESGELRAIYVPPVEGSDNPYSVPLSELSRKDTESAYGTLNPGGRLMTSDELREELDRIVESSAADGGAIVACHGQDYVKVELLFSPHNAGIDLGVFEGDRDD